MVRPNRFDRFMLRVAEGFYLGSVALEVVIAGCLGAWLTGWCVGEPAWVFAVLGVANLVNVGMWRVFRADARKWWGATECLIR